MIRDLIPDWSKQGYVGYQEAYFVSKYDLRNYVYIKVVNSHALRANDMPARYRISYTFCFLLPRLTLSVVPNPITFLLCFQLIPPYYAFCSSPLGLLFQYSITLSSYYPFCHLVPICSQLFYTLHAGNN